jgi:hypothetical protein
LILGKEDILNAFEEIGSLAKERGIVVDIGVYGGPPSLVSGSSAERQGMSISSCSAIRRSFAKPPVSPRPGIDSRKNG